MSNFRSTKIGLAALTIIFLLLYGYFSTLGKPSNQIFDPIIQGFANNEIVLGNLGGFHIIKNINYSDENQFHRLIIDTELNRSTASPEDITIPYTVIQEITDATAVTPSYQMKIKLSDSTIENIPQDRPLAIFPTTLDSSEPAQLIQEVRVNQISDENAEITISLTKSTRFRAIADNSGAIILDILK
ncbi:MAG: hypothetical protein WC805_03110 [Patescibacteria group bacterium]|jgi:hypothetical protein